MRSATIDVFCGAGGLTRGLEIEGLEVRAGIDIDPECRYPYEANNWARFIEADAEALRGSDLDSLWDDCDIRILAGCAPCQPFSNYTQARQPEVDQRWRLLRKFGGLVDELRPEIVTIENVAELRRHAVYAEFKVGLAAAEYHLHETIADCELYGVPQRRRRLVLLASRLGQIRLLTAEEFGAAKRTVRDVIGDLPPIRHGGDYLHDRLHRSSRLSPTNQKRMKASRPGGSWADWDENLVAPCHVSKSGKGYRSVYGRMEWDKVAPTITTQAFGFGSGRFGHPEQDRAISLREAALLQTFPRDYHFAPAGVPVRMKTLGRLIGNAVPVRLGRVVGRSIIFHVRSIELGGNDT